MTEIVAVSTWEQMQSVSRLAFRIWKEHYTPIIGQSQVDYMLGNLQTPEAIREQIREGYWYYLVYHQGREAGYLALKPEKDSAQLSKIYVISDLRGLGLGRKALEHAQNVCLEAGLTRLWLTVNKNNHGAISFYERTGFFNSGSVVQDIGGGFVMDGYKMVKSLSPG